MFNRLKCRLLRWLLNDICRKSKDCSTCTLDIVNESGIAWRSCMKNYALRQAEKVWGLGTSEEE